MNFLEIYNRKNKEEFSVEKAGNTLFYYIKEDRNGNKKV